MKYHHRTGSAMIVAIFITMTFMLIGLYLLENIIPISRSVKGIENGNIAYYQAQSAVENAIYQIDPSAPGADFSTGKTISPSVSWTGTVIANSTIIPIPGQGNSGYNPDFNQIGIGQPIQLKLPNGITSLNDWSHVKFSFQVPNGTLSGSNTPIISWILTGSGDSLYASGSQVIVGNINNKISLNISTKNGTTISGTGETFQDFYDTYCSVNLQCTLKLGIINPLELTNGEHAPYLEYKIDFGSISVPQQYAIINADGYAGGFKQSIRKEVQQITTNEALDFTVFQ